MAQANFNDFEQNPAKSIGEYIRQFIIKSPENCLKAIDNSPIFAEPLVAFADGYDPLFLDYKQIIGSFHLTPREALEKASHQSLNDSNKDMDDISVVCWVLPVAKKTRLSNRQRKRFASKRWALTRKYGEILNNSLRQHLVMMLTQLGYLAVAPVISNFFQTIEQPDGLTSNWSERHAAYVAGLGTFSLNDGFITPKGIAMRCGSIVTNLKLPPSQRKCVGYASYCLFSRNGICSKCIDRCPAGAITTEGHDKRRCWQYIKEVRSLLSRRGFEAELAGCGLCQTKVPCESRIPISEADI